ncbi:probable C-mannosyltransferase DPY19L4 isoform X2 [Ambystoma mexicanum]|uniref:probable C-mannosyltransferase DPY19L4 isoform X2 n=1 Tax=Ambystoma mexicanum TaxID=8296 RepID=UPI0037E85A4B
MAGEEEKVLLTPGSRSSGMVEQEEEDAAKEEESKELEEPKEGTQPQNGDEPVEVEKIKEAEGADTELRQRKKLDESDIDEMIIKEISKVPIPFGMFSNSGSCQRFLKLFCGVLAAVTSGFLYTIYLAQSHPQKLLFSTRQVLEQELMFQGEGAMYYSFFKDMLRAPSFERGVFELSYNNNTVSLRTINAVQQMTLYPELIISALYWMSDNHDAPDPVFFYIGIVLMLQGIYMSSLFVTSWILSGSCFAGILTAAWFVINSADTTRMYDSIPLRENWALPYFAFQIAALTGYLKNNLNPSTERLCYLLVSASTYTFMMMWEYSHYVLFVQAVALFFLDGLSLAQNDKINVREGTFMAKVMKIIYIFLVCAISLTLHLFIKAVVPHKDNGHILKFLEVKFGLNMTKNFTMRWLLCQASLQTPSQDSILRLTQSSLLPFYIVVFTICLLSVAQVIVRRLCGMPLKDKLSIIHGRIGERPEIVYHVFHSILFGSFAMIFDGMKYLWTPYVCVLAAFGVCSAELWITLFKWIRLKAVDAIMLALLLSTIVPSLISTMLWREFSPKLPTEYPPLEDIYQPDTVELMNWIKTQAPVAAVFAGSPLLMGAIKMCTGYLVTSLPVYNDEDFMKRNENVYQIYAMRSAEDIYKILISYKANYVVIEDSICNEMGTARGCRVKDLLDIANGHVVDEDGDSYAYSKYGRFCHEIKFNYSPYVNYFTRVFWNRSYFVYKVNSVISFQY